MLNSRLRNQNGSHLKEGSVVSRYQAQETIVMSSAYEICCGRRETIFRHGCNAQIVNNIYDLLFDNLLILMGLMLTIT